MTEYVGIKAGDEIYSAYEVIARGVGINPLVVLDLGWSGRKERCDDRGLVPLTPDEVRAYLSDLIAHCEKAIATATARRDRLVTARDQVAR